MIKLTWTNVQKWKNGKKRGKFEKTLQEKIKNPDLELSLRELKTKQIKSFQCKSELGVSQKIRIMI